MEEATKNKEELHVVMLPWSAFGHMLPFFNLATSLANHGVRISYLSTPRNIARLPKIPQHLTSLMKYVPLPMPPSPVLKDGAEATSDVEMVDIQYLKKAYDGLYEPVLSYVLGDLPDWIMCDFLAYWMPQVAQQCRAHLIFFSIFSATLLCPPPTPSYVVQDDTEKDESGISTLERANRMMTGCKAICIRTCREFEADALDHAKSIYKNMPIVPVGFLPPSKVVRKQQIGDDDASWDKIFKWLDQQIQGSVVYVTFGSEVKLTKHEVYEIAYGLELSQLPFVWALAKPSWAKHDSEALPPDFLNRTSEKGIVCLGWAPQLEILSHASVGGVLFHGGWSTLLETLLHGHNAIILPFANDQWANARLMVEKGLGVEVERRDNDGSYTRNNVADAVGRAMVGDEAHKIKAKVTELARVFGDHDLQERYVTDFVKFLKQNRESSDNN